MVAKLAHIYLEDNQGAGDTSLSITYTFDDIYLGYDIDVEDPHIDVSRFVLSQRRRPKAGFLKSFEDDSNDAEYYGAEYYGAGLEYKF